MTRQRRTLLLVFGGVIAAAAALAVALVLVSRGGGSDSTPTTAAQPAARTALLAGIRQSGVTLGDPSAPELSEYADLQCPYCADASRKVLPTVIREYVRTGKVKLVFRGLAFIGPDSTKALKAVYAAGRQDRLWDVLDSLYAAQGAENSGWVTDELLTQIGSATPGLDVEKWKADFESQAVVNEFAAASDAAMLHGVQSTPTFFLGDARVDLTALTPEAFKAALDPLLAE